MTIIIVFILMNMVTIMTIMEMKIDNVSGDCDVVLLGPRRDIKESGNLKLRGLSSSLIKPVKTCSCSLGFH